MFWLGTPAGVGTSFHHEPAQLFPGRSGQSQHCPKGKWVLTTAVARVQGCLWHQSMLLNIAPIRAGNYCMGLGTER